MKFSIIPSIIARSQDELEKRIEKISILEPKLIHLDIMDGLFVKNTSLEFDFKIMLNSKKEAHLMVEFPKPWFINNLKKIDSIIVHYESNSRIHEIIKLSRDNGKKIGIAISPNTPSESISHYVNLLDKITILTVNPGKYGEKFILSMLNKIIYIRGLSKKINIEVDGGINPKTLLLCKKAGANQFVVGSFLQKAKNIKKAYDELEKSIKLNE